MGLLARIIPEPIKRRWRLIGLLAWAFSFVLFAIFAADLIGEEPLWPWLWPSLYITTAGLIFALVLRPESHRLMWVSGSVACLAYASRPAAAMWRWIDGGINDFSRVGISAVLCLPLALLTLWFWYIEVKPWSLRHSTDITAYGD